MSMLSCAHLVHEAEVEVCQREAHETNKARVLWVCQNYPEKKTRFVKQLIRLTWEPNTKLPQDGTDKVGWTNEKKGVERHTHPFLIWCSICILISVGPFSPTELAIDFTSMTSWLVTLINRLPFNLWMLLFENLKEPVTSLDRYKGEHLATLTWRCLFVYKDS